MSFAFKVTTHPDTAAAELEQATNMFASSESDPDAAADARAIAVAVVRSFCEQLGDGYAEVIVSVGGHANANHESTFGWQPDSFSVSVQAVR